MARDRAAALELAADLAHGAEALGDDVVVVDRLQVDLAGEEEVAVDEVGVARERLAERETDGVLDEPWLEVRVLDDEELVGPLQELVDRRAHRALDEGDQVLGVHRPLGAEVEGAAAALVVGRDGDELEDPVDLVLAVAGLEQALARAPADEPLRAYVLSAAWIASALNSSADRLPTSRRVAPSLAAAKPTSDAISCVGSPVTGVVRAYG